VLTLTQKERDRLVILRQLADGTLKLGEAARRLGRSPRQARRLRRRFGVDGDAAVVHALRGRPSNRRLPEELRTKALAKSREPLYADFGPTLLSEHLARDPEIGLVHPSTLRLWMIEDGRWAPRRRKNRHRRRRERRAAYGELVLMDTSIHPWLEGRSEEEIVLIALIDDATSRLYCRFFPRDTGGANRQLLVDYLQRFGRMRAVYADRAGHFQAHFRKSEREAKDQEKALTLIERALAALDIELIHALSPQAKGRVERLFGTLQDRLIKEMRVAGITSLEDANRFLEEVFIPFWDGRFTVEPAEQADAHLPLPEGVDLQRIFAETDERVIRNDFTFRYKNQHYQLERSEADEAMPATRITIERRLDGSTRFRWRDRYLEPTPIAERPRPQPEPQPPPPPKPTRPGRPIPPDHPWRRKPFLVGKGVHRPPQIVASAPAALQPDSPAVVGAGP
jgi:hypothetical protein